MGKIKMIRATSKLFSLCFILFLVLSCKYDKKPAEDVVLWTPYNDSTEVAANADHENRRMQYKLIQSKVLDKNDVFIPLYNEVSKITEATYDRLKPLIVEQNIPAIQAAIANGALSYEELVLFYLYRIYKYELDNSTTLNTILALNENVVAEARELDKLQGSGEDHHPIYGMPILLKDNINTSGMNTTAGAIALQGNNPSDAFIVQRLKQKGALILGKVNLSEWAYYLCGGCPVGYSAVGGQTLNPYGRRIFETGGSSSGSGTSMAANYAVAAVGTETSGSILSPSSQNSVVGLKPTIGLLSRSGIVPISSTLDTPGPMTRNTIDNAIVLDAMMGYDKEDASSVTKNWDPAWYKEIQNDELQGKRFGAFSYLMERDTIYKTTMEHLSNFGAEIVLLDRPNVELNGFSSILNLDMKDDLPNYLEKYTDGNTDIEVHSVSDVIAFNMADSITRIPYGQARFDGILADTTSLEQLEVIKTTLEKNTREYFNTALDENNLDAILSINNYHAGYAAIAKYPALTVPMGYKKSGEPISLTFIAKQFQEVNLLHLGAAFEKATKVREMPASYK